MQHPGRFLLGLLPPAVIPGRSSHRGVTSQLCHHGDIRPRVQQAAHKRPSQVMRRERLDLGLFRPGLQDGVHSLGGQPAFFSAIRRLEAKTCLIQKIRQEKTDLGSARKEYPGKDKQRNLRPTD